MTFRASRWPARGEPCSLVRGVGCQVGLGERLEHARDRSRRDPQRLRELSGPHRGTGRAPGGDQSDRLDVILDGQAGHGVLSSQLGEAPGGSRSLGGPLGRSIILESERDPGTVSLLISTKRFHSPIGGRDLFQRTATPPTRPGRQRIESLTSPGCHMSWLGSISGGGLLCVDL